MHFHKTNEINLTGQNSKVMWLKPELRARLTYWMSDIIGSYWLNKDRLVLECMWVSRGANSDWIQMKKRKRIRIYFLLKSESNVHVPFWSTTKSRTRKLLYMERLILQYEYWSCASALNYSSTTTPYLAESHWIQESKHESSTIWGRILPNPGRNRSAISQCLIALSTEKNKYIWHRNETYTLCHDFN